ARGPTSISGRLPLPSSPPTISTRFSAPSSRGWIGMRSGRSGFRSRSNLANQFLNYSPLGGRPMRSVDAIGARKYSAALFLFLPAIMLVIDTRPPVRGDDKPAVKPLPAELATAIRDGDLKAVREQLEGGVDVNARDADGNTPLLLAAVYAGPECVELLLKNRADVNAKNKFGATPLHRAATNY